MHTKLPALFLILAVPFLGTAVAWQSTSSEITFSGNIAPILYENCVTCHRPGEAAPFSLITYEDVKKRGALIATVTASRYMPPWHAAHGYGEFADERRLTDAQIAAIGQWVKEGMPEGNPAQMPRVPQFTEGWQLGKPDLILEMPAAFTVPASGPDLYRNFTIPTGVSEDKWVRAVEFRPTARKVVHHAIFSYVRSGSVANLDGADGKPGFSGGAPVGLRQGTSPAGSLGGWAVGNTPRFWPEGFALSMPKGTDIVLQLHFHPTGKPETERSVIGIYFATKAPERAPIGIDIPALFGFGSGLNIPAGEKNYTVEDSVILPADVKAFAVSAHAHYVGKEMKAVATLPNGSTQPLLWIQDWNFNWQDTYLYKQPVVLPKGTRIDVKIRYDNSADNPRNPNAPPKRVQWGEESYSEMAGVALLATPLRVEDEPAFRQMGAERTAAALKRGVEDGTVKRFLAAEIVSRAVVAGPRLSQITLFDREGKAIRTVGEPGAYAQPALSPDGTRVAVTKNDQAARNADIWIFDISTGEGTAFTADANFNSFPVWSPDGRHLAYVTNFGTYNALFRKPADGSGSEELLYRTTTAAAIVATDWMNDALTFWTGGITFVLPLTGDRQPVKLFSGRAGRFSPDGRLIAYSADQPDQPGRFELFVSPLTPAPSITPIPTRASQITKEGAVGGIFWRADGKELYFFANPGQTIMAVDVITSPEFKAGTPRVLFKNPAPVLGPAQLSSIASPDGERFVFLQPVPANPASR
jgi:hypothetical protein